MRVQLLVLWFKYIGSCCYCTHLQERHIGNSVREALESTQFLKAVHTHLTAIPKTYIPTVKWHFSNSECVWPPSTVADHPCAAQRWHGWGSQGTSCIKGVLHSSHTRCVASNASHQAWQRRSIATKQQHFLLFTTLHWWSAEDGTQLMHEVWLVLPVLPDKHRCEVMLV